MEHYHININGLKLFGHHGVLPHEAEIGQFFLIDLTLKVERENPSDEVASVVDYGHVSLAVKSIFDAHRYQLLESLVEAIFIGLKEYPAIKGARITIAKPNPPIPLPLDSVAVTYERGMN